MSKYTYRILQVIEFMAHNEDWVSLRAMARELEFDATTVFRILSDLEDMGYVRQHSSDSRYQLTLKIVSISANVLEKVQIRQIAIPIMESLTSKTNETTHLAILNGEEFVYIHKVNNDQAVRMRSLVGQRGKLHCTAVGKSLLAFMPENQAEKVISNIVYKPATPNSISNKAQLLEQLKQIRISGYSIDDEENEVGIRCVGAPIFDYSNNVAGALSVSGWTITMTPERLPAIIPELIKASKQISKELGYSQL